MSYQPEFKGPIEGWVVNSLKKNLWRIAATHTYEEAMQEAHMVFLRCAQRYPDMDTPQHFMALFQVSWVNEVHDLSKLATNAREAVSLDQLTYSDEGYTPLEVIGEVENDGVLAVKLRQAPKEVTMVLNLFLNAPQELLELAMSAWRKNRNYKSDGDRAVSRMLGLPQNSTPMSTTRDYFS